MNIGRLGALAVALGIGWALAGPACTASAAPGADPAASDSAASDSGAGARSAAGKQVSARNAGPGAAPQSSAARTRGAAATARNDAADSTGTDSGVPRPAATAVSVPKAAAEVAEPEVDIEIPVPVVGTGEGAADEAIAYSVAGNDGDVPTPVTTAAPVTTAYGPVAPTRANRATARANRAVAVVATAQSVTALGPLPGTGTGDAPGQGALAWSLAAWTRREFERTVTAGQVAAGQVTAEAVATSPNLLVNPGAELGDPSLSGYSAVTIPGWTLTGTPTVIQYGAARNLWPIGTSFKMPDLPSFLGFPKPGSGPADGGNQFFGGGDVATGTLTQMVDLRGAAGEIDLGDTTYNLGAWLGGYLWDRSGSSVKVTFLDANKTYLGDAELSRVGALERWFQTGFKERTTTGVLPVGTRYAQVVVTLEDRHFVTLGIPWLLGGVDFDYNNAFADNISFTVGATLPAPPDPTPPVSAVGELDHVFMVYMENKGYNDIVGSTKAPFLNSLIDAYGSATQYHGLTHPSLPNYYPVIGGTDFGLTYNCATPCIDADTTLVSNITAAGKTWRGYAQSLQPGADPLVAAGDYSPDQLPFPAYKSIANDPAALANVVPLEQMAEDLKSAATAPNYAWFAANEDFNGEGPVDFPWGVLNFALSQLEPGNPYNIPALDQFLSETVPVVLNSEVWKDPTLKSALIVTFDEDNNNTSLGFGNEGNRVVFVVIPSQGAVDAGMRAGAFSATNHYNHYSLLRFIEDSLGLPTLTNNDKFAAPLNEFWVAGVTGGAESVV